MPGNFGLDIDVDSHGAPHRLRLWAHQADESLKNALQDLAIFAGERMRFHAPEGKTGHLRRSVQVGNLGKVTPRRGAPAPGAIGAPFVAGKGYEINVNVGAYYAKYVSGGTGLFGPKGKEIKPSKGNVMSFTKEGEGEVTIKSAEGQRANPFVALAAADVQAVMNLKVEEIRREIESTLGPLPAR